MKFAHYFTSPLVVRLLILLTINAGYITRVSCLNFSYPMFNEVSQQHDFIFSENSQINLGTLQVTPDIFNGVHSNMSGRVLYDQPFKLWESQTSMKASFITSFVFNIEPLTSPTGDGLAFILTEQIPVPVNSGGQWLGIINISTTGLSNIIGVEFDTRKSYEEDIDDNHVGIDVRSAVSINSKSLTDHGVNISAGIDIRATIQYDALPATMTIYVSAVNDGNHNMEKPIISQHIHLSDYLPEDVYVGFSASTGADACQVNTVKSWSFTSFETSEKEAANHLWIWILVPAIGVSVLFMLMFYRFYSKKNRHKTELVADEDIEMELKIQRSSTAPQKFHLKELEIATRSFNSMNKLGKGGFGTVYKGTLGNKTVAVKRISKNSRHGKQDFIAEVTSIGNLHHKNLVKLLGWCYERNELVLVYEFMPNGSLDKFVSRIEMADSEAPNLTWERRHNILCGVAQALQYLHNGCEKRVLHRDIKTSNILLDFDFNARVGDFGLARVIQLNEKTHHSTKEIAGTLGYMAPESFHAGRATIETDIYAFGVVILEIVCGRKPIYQCEADNYNYNYNISIVDWVWEKYSNDRLGVVVDSRINEDVTLIMEQIKNVLMLGLACCHPNPYQRPSMNVCLQVLTGETEPPEVPVEKPAFMWPAMALPRELGCAFSGVQFTSTIEFSGR